MKEPALVYVKRKDLAAVVWFILEWFPGYESALHWGDHMDGGDYEWYKAAKRLKRQIAKEETHDQDS